MASNCLFYLLTTKQCGQTPPCERHFRQLFSNLLLCLAGKTMVRVLSTFGGDAWTWFGLSRLKFTIGDLARLAGDIHTRGPGRPPPGGLSCTGRLKSEPPLFPALWMWPRGCDTAAVAASPDLSCLFLLLSISLWDGLDGVNLWVSIWPSELRLMLTMGESGKDLSSSSDMTWPTSWKVLTGLTGAAGCLAFDAEGGGGGGSSSWAGCSGSTLNLTMLLLDCLGGKSCHFWPSPGKELS